MNELVKALAQARKQEREAREKAEALRAELAASPLSVALTRAEQELAEARFSVNEADSGLRLAALAIYENTGNKSPHPGVAIKMFTVVRYEEAVALEYASQHLPQALKLDKAIFEKAAKAVAIPSVDVLQEPRVTIAKDLGEEESAP